LKKPVFWLRADERADQPRGKALWYIESRFGQELALDEVASAAGVSRYRISRVFALATGRSVMEYVRGRRLSEAARVLARGAPGILAWKTSPPRSASASAP
jgi:AraC family transcriptional regulator